MKVRLPSITFQPIGTGYALRPKTLAGLRVGFLDGWGDRDSNGIVSMYPAMAELEKLLRSRCAVGTTTWLKKPKISEPVPDDMLEGLAAEVDVVVNGEGL
jgi:hypothetical protein